MSSPSKPRGGRPDGRTLRAERSRRAVAAAMLELIREGRVRPTAAEVAERAQVSLRLVFHHFDDMDAVYREAFGLQMEALRPLLLIDVTPGTRLDRRIRGFVRARARLYEFITPVRRAARHAEPQSPTIADILQSVRGFKRQQVEELFAAELAGFPKGERGERLAAVQAASSWMTWESLRAHQGLSEDKARRVVRRMMTSLLVRAPEETA